MYPSGPRSEAHPHATRRRAQPDTWHDPNSEPHLRCGRSTLLERGWARAPLARVDDPAGRLDKRRLVAGVVPDVVRLAPEAVLGGVGAVAGVDVDVTPAAQRECAERVAVALIVVHAPPTEHLRPDAGV